MTTTIRQAWWREPTRAQWLSFAAAWLGWVLDAFDFTIFMLVMDDIAREFGVRYVATTASLALTLLMRLAGGFVAGSVADRWGRRLPLMIAIVWFAVCDGAVAFAPSFGWVLVLRALFGFGMGAEWTAGTTLAMEHWPVRSRGIASGILQGSWAIGYLAAAVASAFILPRWGWRGLFITAALPALFVLPIRLWVPESPEFARAGRAGRKAVAMLRTPGALAKLVWASVTMALGFGAYYGLSGLYPTLLRVELGQSPRAVATLVALFNVGMLGGSIAAGVVAARRGVTTAIVVPALACLPLLALYLGVTPSLLPVGALAGGALGVGFCGVVPLLLTDLFDADVRARSIGVVYHVGAALAAMVPLAEASLAQYGGLSLRVSVGVVAGACEAALVVLVLLQRGVLERRLSMIRSSTKAAALPAVLGLLALSCAADTTAPIEVTATTSAALDTVASFGANPGNLLMYRYVPAGVPPKAPLVVVLHGCEQAATAMATVGFDTLADQQKFYVVYPQQQTANNSAQCFDWFGQFENPSNKANITRGQGENESIKEMVDKMKADFSIDAARVYVAGFSAGAAMAAVMLAAWPDVFAAGGIGEGIPYDCPSTVNNDVFTCMNPGKTQTAPVWGAAVKQADGAWTGPWPRVSIWEGTADTTVATANETELVKQWTDVHGLSATPTSSGNVDGQARAVYADASGRVQVESWQIAGMSHGFAVDPTHGCGTAGAYVYDEHICEAGHMLEFFDLGATSPADAGPGGSSSSSGGSGGSSSSGSGSGSGSGGTGSGGGGHGGSGGSAAPGGGPDAGGSLGGSGIAGCGVARPGKDEHLAPMAALVLATALVRRRNAGRRTS
ncbi:MAG TPA: PHB depolymerase family esterase [Polyangiaceae bacterium]